MTRPRDFEPEDHVEYVPVDEPIPAGTATPVTQHDPTTPLQDDSSRIDSTVTGPGQNGEPLYGTTQQKVAGLAYPKDAPKPNDYTEHYHHLTEGDYQQNQKFAHGKDWNALFDGDISHNDEDRLTFGVEEPAKLAAANEAQNNGKQQLGRYANAINVGDVEAVNTADQVLKQGEPGLAFFQFFAPAYNDWKGGGLTYQAAKQAYEAEYGMSFADYVSDAKLLADIGQQLQSTEQGLNNSYNALVPTWQGTAASNFEAKMQMFFQATNTVTTDLSVVAKDIGALVHGLQQLVLAKAQAVSELYAAQLPTGIDGVMASSLVKVAKGDGNGQENLIAFKLLSGEPSGFEQFAIEFGFAGELADRYAPRMATQWCNEILVPQFETREQALKTINAQTKQRISQGFTEFTSQVSQVRDPYTGMGKVGTATAPAAHQPASGGGGGQLPGGIAGGGGSGGAPGGGGAPSGGGTPSVTLPHMPTIAPTVPAGAGTTTTPQGTPSVPTQPTGSGGVPGSGTTSGTPSAPTASTAPTVPAGLTGGGLGGRGLGGGGLGGGLGGAGTPGTPGLINPKRDIHTNPDGSVSLGPDRGLTISPESGKKGAFTVSNTDADGTRHVYRVRFDKHGNPVVTEEKAPDALGAEPMPGITSPVADLGGAGGGLGGGGGLPGGLPTGGGVPAGADVSTPAAHAGAQLQDGTHVGADNATDDAMSASGAAAASPVAGAAPGQPSGSGGQGGGFGGIPVAGGGRGGAGGAQEQESARRYQQKGDVVGEDELEEWQRMGPVIGEQ